MNKNSYLIFAALGMDLVALEVTLLLAGKWIDQKMGWQGFGIAGGGMLALAVWFQHIFWAIKRLERMEKEQEKK